MQDWAVYLNAHVGISNLFWVYADDFAVKDSKQIFNQVDSKNGFMPQGQDGGVIYMTKTASASSWWAMLTAQKLSARILCLCVNEKMSASFLSLSEQEKNAMKVMKINY